MSNDDEVWVLDENPSYYALRAWNIETLGGTLCEIGDGDTSCFEFYWTDGPYSLYAETLEEAKAEALETMRDWAEEMQRECKDLLAELDRLEEA